MPASPSAHRETRLAEAIPASRLASMDAYRGFVMLLMVAEILKLSQLKERYPDSAIARWLSFHTSHVEWVGCSLHDMIQPSFSFLVGTAMAFSLVKRMQQGQSFARLACHAAWRSLVLVLLGVFLRSLNSTTTQWTFVDTLSQIGLGYFPLFLIAMTGRSLQVLFLVMILVGYWGLFAAYTLPPTGFDYSTVAATRDHLFDGFLAHWNKNTNPAMAFDRWFLNLFPRERPFEFQAGGYSTLNFIPTLATMLLGLLAGDKLRSDSSNSRKIVWLVLAGVVCVTGGLALQHFGICPIVKRIWTPAFALFSGGICFLMLAGFYFTVDIRGWRRWAFPLTVIGMNSIAIYVMDKTMVTFFRNALQRHFPTVWELGSPEYAATSINVLIMLIFWSILYWMYRHRVFIKI